MLRDYQKELVSKVLSRTDNTLIQADTGAGKTRVLAAIAKTKQHVLLVAHRNTLVSQLSLEFAKAGLYHRMICAKTTARRAELLHRREIGKSMLSIKANRYVCSIDTLISKHKRDKLFIDVNKGWLVIVDEAHHVTEENKWGKLAEIFKSARIIGATATPCRLDGVSLKRGKGGVFDTLVQAESLKKDSVSKLIERGFISPFKCYGVDCRINEQALKKGKNDYTTDSLVNETKKHVKAMAGDAVEHYLRLAKNKQAVAFCVSIDIAKMTADKFRDAGVAAAAIHSKMSKAEVDKIFDLFESKQIQVIFNVDMTGEGVDIPAIEALIMLRKTASFGLYRQWVGRSLRPFTNKEHAIIIDHANNIKEHGLPDDAVEWRIDMPPADKKSNLVECKKCKFLVKAWETVCPECGTPLRSRSELSQQSVKYINTQLVEIHRTRKAKESYDNAKAVTIDSNEIRYLNKKRGKLGEITTKVAKWFFENIKEGITRKQAEDFFCRNNNMEFWSTHFTLAEINSKNKKKCMKVFNEN